MDEQSEASQLFEDIGEAAAASDSNTLYGDLFNDTQTTPFLFGTGSQPLPLLNASKLFDTPTTSQEAAERLGLPYIPHDQFEPDEEEVDELNLTIRAEPEPETETKPQYTQLRPAMSGRPGGSSMDMHLSSLMCTDQWVERGRVERTVAAYQEMDQQAGVDRMPPAQPTQPPQPQQPQPQLQHMNLHQDTKPLAHSDLESRRERPVSESVSVSVRELVSYEEFGTTRSSYYYYPALYCRKEKFIPLNLNPPADAPSDSVWEFTLRYSDRDYEDEPVVRCVQDLHKDRDRRAYVLDVRTDGAQAKTHQPERSSRDGHYVLSLPVCVRRVSAQFLCRTSCGDMAKRNVLFITTLRAHSGDILAEMSTPLRVCELPSRDIQKDFPETEQLMTGKRVRRRTIKSEQPRQLETVDEVSRERRVTSSHSRAHHEVIAIDDEGTYSMSVVVTGSKEKMKSISDFIHKEEERERLIEYKRSRVALERGGPQAVDNIIAPFRQLSQYTSTTTVRTWLFNLDMLKYAKEFEKQMLITLGDIAEVMSDTFFHSFGFPKADAITLMKSFCNWNNSNLMIKKEPE